MRIRIRPEQLALARRQEHESRPAEVDAGSNVGELRGVYIISVAARLLAMHPQTLRKYERLGLVRPSRTIGMLRLYSQEDIEKLRLIRHLEEEPRPQPGRGRVYSGAAQSAYGNAPEAGQHKGSRTLF